MDQQSNNNMGGAATTTESDVLLARRLQMAYAVPVDDDKYTKNEYSYAFTTPLGSTTPTIASLPAQYVQSDEHNPLNPSSSMYYPSSEPGVYAIPIHGPQYGTSSMYAPPPHLFHDRQHLGVSPLPLHLQRVYAQSLGVRFLSFLDLLFLVLNSLYAPLALVFAWGPLSGYFSAIRRSPRLAALYLLYYVLRVAFDGFSLSYGVSVLGVLSMLLDVLIASFVARYLKALRALEPEEREEINDKVARGVRPNAYFVMW